MDFRSTEEEEAFQIDKLFNNKYYYCTSEYS